MDICSYSEFLGVEQLKDFFIYNYLQADFFIKNGLCPVGCGKGGKGDIFVRFRRDEEAERVFYEWRKLKYGEETMPPREY